MARSNLSHATALAFVLLPFLIGACDAQASPNATYKRVESGYAYGIGDRKIHEWRGLMAALDKCHQGGFSNAEPAGLPQITCTEGSASGCTRYHATQEYDCVGMSN